MKTKDYALVALFSALLALCSWIVIPTAVPFTMQTFGIFLSFSLLGGKRSLLALCVYLALGIIGLPVFSGFRGGIGVLLGNTGGYLLGFLFSLLFGWLMEHILGTGTWVQICSIVFGLLLCYAFGTLWFWALYIKAQDSVSFLSILSTCVFPFIVPDLAKLSLAFFVSRRLKKHI